MKFEQRFIDKTKKKWIYVCENKECSLNKYTEGDKRTIEEKYDYDILVFIRKLFLKKFMSFQYNPKIINKREQVKDIQLITGKNKRKKLNRILNRKVNHNKRSYSFTAIRKMTQEYFKKIYDEEKLKYPKKNIPEKKIPSVYAISYYFKKLHGRHNWRIPAKLGPFAPRDSFT